MSFIATARILITTPSVRAPFLAASFSNMSNPKVVEENVWDYPRPPALEKTSRHLRVVWVGSDKKEHIIADTTSAYRVLETSHPPTYYIPPTDIRVPLTKTSKSTFCEWKGVASYHTLDPSTFSSSPSKPIVNRIWSYEKPTGKFGPIKDYLSFYASSGTGGGGEGWRCEVDGETVVPQDGDFYGGWKHSGIVGKMKGGPGTLGW